MNSPTFISRAYISSPQLRMRLSWSWSMSFFSACSRMLRSCSTTWLAAAVRARITSSSLRPSVAWLES